MWLFKKKAVPETNNTKEVEVVRLWIVQWVAPHHYVGSHYRASLKQEAFASKALADEFAISLCNAYKLLKMPDFAVEVREND